MPQILNQDIDLAFDVETKLQAIVINKRGYIIASDGAIVNQSILDIYDNVRAEDYLFAFLHQHMYNNSIDNTLYAIYNEQEK